MYITLARSLQNTHPITTVKKTNKLNSRNLKDHNKILPAL